MSRDKATILSLTELYTEFHILFIFSAQNAAGFLVVMFFAKSLSVLDRETRVTGCPRGYFRNGIRQGIFFYSLSLLENRRV